MATKPRIKPDFSGGSGSWVDPDFFPGEVVREARLHLGESRLSDQQKGHFLAYANDLAQMLERDSTPGKPQQDQIKRVEAAAHELINALQMLSAEAAQALQAHADYLAYGSAPPVLLPAPVLAAIRPLGTGELLSTGFDWAAALHDAAGYAAGQFALSRAGKPELLRARALVSLMAEFVRDSTGRLPPEDRAAWFACAMACLGKHMGLSIGPRVISSGIKSLR